MRTGWIIGAALAMLAVGPRFTADASEPEFLYEGASAEQVREALRAECFNAGMTAQPIAGQMLMCTASVSREERLLDGMVLIDVHEGHVLHRIRFSLAQRPNGVRVWAYPWIEVEEPDGQVFDEEIASQEYLSRVQSVLETLAVTLDADNGGDPREWAEYYHDRAEWLLDAHLRAVAHCDAIVDELDPEQLEAQIQAAGFRPFGRAPRDRCEELYEEVFRWGLARGEEAPTVEAYVAYRDALPAERRVCRGRLALAAPCG